MELERTAACLEALGNPTRLSIYRLLVRAGQAGKAVGQIQRMLDVPASTLSHHLKHLEMVGLVTKRRDGTTHLCVASYETMDAMLAFLTRECCVEAGAGATVDATADASGSVAANDGA
ncbi:helix-turn-helix transcriptional regulator [Marivibrio halodurans]|uniref:Helix-turn-helix transcriptional regulator n=2 Tax=Marivibrio halodurans TaxID=2039722 RepID=A0A8J7SPF0_9PROT|nr:helix-turn-helix transcriptional regulator [Marivibrio halodurans]